MTTNNSIVKAQANSTQQTLSPDVVLCIIKHPTWLPYCVMPLDNRKSEWYGSIEVARVAAETLAKETNGKVIIKTRSV